MTYYSSGSGTQGIYYNDAGSQAANLALSSAFDLAGSYIGNQLIGKPNADRAFNQNMTASAYAFDRSREAYQSRYQDTVEDMKKAGINPIMAASGGFSVGNAPVMAAPQAFQAQVPQFTPTVSGKNVSEISKIAAETKESISRTVKTYNESQKLLSEIGKISKETSEITQRIANLMAERQKIVQEFIKLGYDTTISEKKAKAIKVLENRITESQGFLKNLAPQERVDKLRQQIFDYFKGSWNAIDEYIKRGRGASGGW